MANQIPISLPSLIDGMSPRSVAPAAPPDVVHAMSSEHMTKPSLQCLEEIKTLVKNTRAGDIRTIRTQLTYPLAHHFKHPDMRGNHELQRTILETMRAVVAKTCIDDTKEYMFYLRTLLAVLYDLGPDKRKLTVAILPEELIKDTMKTISLITLMLSDDTRVEVYSPQYKHCIANTIYVASQIIINEKLRSLKSAALTTMAALTGTHDRFLDDQLHPKNSFVAATIANALAKILPGILVALTDVALSKENQGHLITAKAVSSIHRVICLVMNDKYMQQQDDITNADFAQVLIANQTKTPLTRYFARAQTQKETKDTNLTPEFYEMAGNKLKLVTNNLVSLLTHESDKVRKELALFCCRVISECARSMKPSIPDIVDALIGLSEDENEEISKMCSKAIEVHLKDSFRDSSEDITTILADNFHAVVSNLPSVMNNIDSRKKQYNLVLLRAYVTLLDNSYVLRCTNSIAALCNSLVHAARIDSSNMSLLMELSIGDIESSVPVNQCQQQTTPWCKMEHLDNKACEDNVKRLCYCLGAADCAESVVDVLLEMLQQGADRVEIVYLLTHIAAAQSNVNVGRILDAFIDPEMWYVPLEIASSDQPVTEQDTLDVTVYNPRSWEKDSVPGLFEGTVETRYTDISLQKSRQPVQIRDVTKCRTLREAKDNMVLSCLLTDGVGIIAKKLKENFQPYMLQTLCMLLERVGSRYEMLSKAGMKALRDVTIACGHSDVTQLIRNNADYFTYQVTKRLKKEWNCVSALHILTVVLQHSDATIMDCMQGIITDVLLQSCDRYHQNEVTPYLQVFITFVKRIRTWFPRDTNKDDTQGPGKDTNEDWNVLSDTMEYIRNVRVSERLLEASEFENETGMTAEEMYREDLKNKQEDDDEIDYSDDKEKVELPQHIVIVTKILSRCVHLVASSRREEKTLALQVLEQGLPALEEYQDELLPLCHHIWGPLVPRFSETKQPIVLMRALQLLVMMARVAKDFIRDRTVKEVLPKLCLFLCNSSKESLLKDAGSVYRLSHAYRLQHAALDNLATLTVELGLQDRHLDEAMSSASPYLSSRQPKPLQSLAVEYFKKMMEYDPGAASYHLRQLCNNRVVREPPTLPCMKLTLEAVVGTPDHPTDKSYNKNIDLLFGHVV